MKQFLYKIAQSNALRTYLKVNGAISAFGLGIGIVSGSTWGIVDYVEGRKGTQLKDIPPMMIKEGSIGLVALSVGLWGPPVLTSYAISQSISLYKSNKAHNEYLKSYGLPLEKHEEALDKLKQTKKNYYLALSEVRKAEKTLQGNKNSIEFQENLVNARKVLDDKLIIYNVAYIEERDLNREL